MRGLIFNHHSFQVQLTTGPTENSDFQKLFDPSGRVNAIREQALHAQYGPKFPERLVLNQFLVQRVLAHF